MLSKEIATYLQSQSLGTIGTNLFYGFLPESPDTLTVVFDTGGQQPESRLSIDYPSIQIRTRAGTGASSIATAYARLAMIYDALHNLHNILLSDGTRLIDCKALQSAPITIGKDENNRAEFTLNFILTTSKKTTNRE